MWHGNPNEAAAPDPWSPILAFFLVKKNEKMKERKGSSKKISGEIEQNLFKSIVITTEVEEGSKK